MRTLRSIRYFLLALVILAIPATAHAQFSASISVAPPELVVYSQPICPQEGYLWTPGYWAYGNEGYAWNGGYWGTEVGFYGGVNYGFGYGGSGYEGGYWRNNQFSYNTYVNNVGGERFRNTYNKTVVVNTTNYVSYNGGSGGITARPTAAEESFARGHHTSPTAAQSGQREVASKNREMLASVNHGRPAIAATSKPGEFTGKGVVAAREAPAEHRTTENKAAETKATENRAEENKAAERKTSENKAAENKGNATRAAETKATENRAAENRAAETKATENKAEASRKTASRASENKAAEKKPAARPAADTGHARATPAPTHSATRPAQPAAKP